MSEQGEIPFSFSSGLVESHKESSRNYGLARSQFPSGTWVAFSGTNFINLEATNSDEAFKRVVELHLKDAVIYCLN